MERYAAGTRCRHRTLVEYFGQAYERADCGACDWCLKELDAVADSLTIAQKILSCVARVKQTWGTAHVTDVLTGKATEKVVAVAAITSCRRSALLKEEAPAAIRGYIEQLVGDGLLAREGDPYPVLRLTAAGASLLRGDGECQLYREVKPPSSKKRSRSGVPRHVHGDDRLRSVRRRCARCACGSRASAACRRTSSSTTRRCATWWSERPNTIDDLHEVYGVGAKKAADFGDAFLDAIRTFRRPE